MKYLLSTGNTTDSIEYYIIDLFRLQLTIFPGDIPGKKDYGFDFILSDIYNASLLDMVRFRLDSLINKIQDRFYNKYKIEITSLELLDDNTIRLVVNINSFKSNDIIFNLQKDI